MQEVTIDQQFIEFIAKNLVDNEADVRVERLVDERGVLLTLFVNPEDLGRVIGKRGAIAESMRTLLRSLGMKHGAHYNLKIADTDVVDTAKLVVFNISKNSASTYRGTVGNEVDKFTITNGNELYNCDLPNASSALESPVTMTIEETV